MIFQQRLQRHLFGFLDYAIGIYVLITILVSRFSVSSVSSALMVAPNLFLIPYLIGASISNAFSKELIRQHVPFRFLVGFLVGSLFLHSSFVLAQFSGMAIQMLVFNAIIIAIVLFGFLVDLSYRLSQSQRNFSKYKGRLTITRVDAEMLFSFAAPLSIALLAFCIPKILVPFPLASLDGGVGQEIFKPVNRLLTYGYLDVYSTRGLPVILEGVVCSFSGIPVQNLNWAAPLGTCLVFSFSMFSLVKSVSRRIIIALPATMLAFFLNNAGLSFDVISYIFRYSTIIAAVFPLVIAEAYLHFVEAKKQSPDVRKHVLLLFIGTLSAIAVLWGFEFLKPAFLVSLFQINEFFRPFVYLIFIAFSLIYMLTLKNSALKNLVLILAFFTPFAIALDILRPVISVLFLYLLILLIDVTSSQTAKSTAIETGHLGLSLVRRRFGILYSLKANFLKVIAVLLVIFLLGMVTGVIKIEEFAPFYGAQVTTNTKAQGLIASDSIAVLVVSVLLGLFLVFSSQITDIVFGFILLVSMFTYFLPLFELYYTAHEFMNVFMSLVLSLGILRLVTTISSYSHISADKISAKKKFFAARLQSLTCFLLLFVILVPVVSASFNRFGYLEEGATHSSLLANYELSAVSDYLSKTSEDTRIISDPFTMIYLSSYLSHVALIGDSMNPFGKQSASVIETVWQNIFHGHSSSEIYSNITSLDTLIPFSEEHFLQQVQPPFNLSKYIVIVSARTAWWLDQGDPYGYYPLFPQTYNVTFSSITKFFDPRFFTPVYTVAGKIYVFLVEGSSVTLAPVADGNVLSLSSDNLGNSLVSDMSGYGNNATAYGVSLVNASGVKSLGFDGLDDYLEVADSNSLHLVPPFTVEFTACPSINKPWMAVYKGEPCADNSWYIYSENTHTIVAVYWLDGTRYSVAYSYDFLDKWTQIVVVYQGPGEPVLLFVNGLLVASGASMPSGTSFSVEKLWIGRYEQMSYCLSGFMGDVHIYRGAMTEEEIYTNYLSWSKS